MAVGLSALHLLVHDFNCFVLFPLTKHKRCRVCLMFDITLSAYYAI
jgi:hypothetical protein